MMLADAEAVFASIGVVAVIAAVVTLAFGLWMLR